MKKIKCLSMVVLALGLFAFSANAQNVKEVRKQELAKKVKAHKILEATPNMSQQTTKTKDVELKAKPASRLVKGELKLRPNATQRVTKINSVKLQKKSNMKAAENRPAQQLFTPDKQKRTAKLSQRMSNRTFDMNAAKQKIKERKSNQ